MSQVDIGKHADRFWCKVAIADDKSSCWEWQAAIRKTYGAFRLNGRIRQAHVVAWMLTHGRELPRGMEIMHSCDNTRCVNPLHLTLGTHERNMRDASEKQRLRRRKRLTEDQVVLIRRLHVPRVVTADMISRMLQLPFPTVDHVVRGITFKSLRPESGAPDTENAGGHEQV